MESKLIGEIGEIDEKKGENRREERGKTNKRKEVKGVKICHKEAIESRRRGMRSKLTEEEGGIGEIGKKKGEISDSERGETK